MSRYSTTVFDVELDELEATQMDEADQATFDEILDNANFYGTLLYWQLRVVGRLYKKYIHGGADVHHDWAIWHSKVNAA